MGDIKRNYHKESGYKAQKKWEAKSDLKTFGVTVHEPEYIKLKSLADASNLSMSKFILQTIKEKYPEVFND